MGSIGFELLLIGGLLFANGVFAVAEIALVSSRRARLQSQADAGDARAALALGLSKDPGKFLSTVQVGITLVGTLAAAVGGAQVADALAATLRQSESLALYADYIALAIVVVVLTYLQVVLGELVPKRLALVNPERTAGLLAGPMVFLSRAASPVVWLLDRSSTLVLRALGVGRQSAPQVSEEEVRVMIDEGADAGVFKRAEAKMMEGVLDLDEQTVGNLMTPRAHMIWLNLDDPDEENWRRITGSGHSNFPVYQGIRDNVLGMATVKALWANLSLAGKADLKAVLTPPLYVPTTMHSSKLIDEFRRNGQHIALAVDEFGTVQGLITLHDVMEAILGRLPEKQLRRDPEARRREDGSWLVDALLELEPAKTTLNIPEALPGEEDGRFRTIGGFVLSQLGHLPREGERVHWQGWTFEVIDMDKQRIDKLLVTPPAAPAQPPPAAGPGPG